MEQLQIKTPSVDQPVRYLSGGNQQKVALAKWLSRYPPGGSKPSGGSSVLILQEPTQGVDIAVRFEIYEQIAALARADAAVLLIFR